MKGIQTISKNQADNGLAGRFLTLMHIALAVSEILSAVLREIAIRDLSSASRVCKIWEPSANEILWREASAADLLSVLLLAPSVSLWKSLRKNILFIKVATSPRSGGLLDPSKSKDSFLRLREFAF